MTWRELPPLTTDVAAQLPALHGIALVGGRIGDYREELRPEEQPAVARAQPKRIEEFSTGRRLARCAMEDIGLPAMAVPRAENRCPVWPDGVAGSITHAGDVAVAAVTLERTARAVGVDLERIGRITERLHGKIFTESERAHLAGSDPRLAELVFSAKEAGYKAVSPKVGKYIGFLEAEVDVDWPSRTWRLRYVGQHEPNRLMEQGEGHFCFFEQYVLTVFIIP